jgi:hypothetical protein
VRHFGRSLSGERDLIKRGQSYDARLVVFHDEGIRRNVSAPDELVSYCLDAIGYRVAGILASKIGQRRNDRVER